MYPGCNRKFNVNSNMRRHYRNHLTPRRSDVVSRFLQPPSPSLSSSTSVASPGESPLSSFSTNLPAVSNRRYSSASRSLSPSSSGTSTVSDGEDDAHALEVPQRSYRRRQTLSELSRETQNLSLRSTESNTLFEEDRCRMRSLSSPIRHSHLGGEPGRPQVGGSCNVPGCRGCQAGISTALRPAFP